MYAYNADTYCDTCGLAIIEYLRSQNIEDDGTNDTFPQYADEDFQETDSPCHCAACATFIPCPLTDDGREYVLERILEDKGDPIVLNEWGSFYGIRKPEEQDTLNVFDYETSDLLGEVSPDKLPPEFIETHWSGDGWGYIDPGQAYNGSLFGYPGRTVSLDP